MAVHGIFAGTISELTTFLTNFCGAHFLRPEFSEFGSNGDFAYFPLVTILAWLGVFGMTNDVVSFSSFCMGSNAA